MTDTSREAFEKWAQSFRCSFKTVQSAPYTYCNRDVQFIWESWQASRNALADEQAHLGLNEAQQVAVPMTDDELASWFASENGLEDCEMLKFADFEIVIRAVEAKHGIGVKLVTKPYSRRDHKPDWSAA